MAENVHDVWAQQRMAEGWTYGPRRDDDNKKHPCLTEYSALSDSEKEYDRKSAMETIKCILSMGYCIRPPECEELPTTSAPFLRQIADGLMHPSPMTLSELHNIWEKHNHEEWAALPDIYPLLAERIIKVGEPLLAYDVLSKGLKLFPRNTDLRLLSSHRRRLYVKLRQLLGLALAQSGSTETACRILSELYKQGARDGETLGVLGRTYKDMGSGLKDENEKKKKFAKAYDYYYEAYQIADEHQDADAAY